MIIPRLVYCVWCNFRTPVAGFIYHKYPDKVCNSCNKDHWVQEECCYSCRKTLILELDEYDKLSQTINEGETLSICDYCDKIKPVKTYCLANGFCLEICMNCKSLVKKEILDLFENE